MKLAYKHENRAILHSAKNVLESYGIDCHIKNDHGNTMGGEFGIANTLLELWVMNDSELTKANDILEREVINPEFKPTWTCPSCKEDNEGSFDFCWNCQTEKS
jgi:hypothetical protein